MTEEVKPQEGNQPEPEQKVQLTEIEQRASESGWVPKDQWDGDPEQWRPAKEFLDRGELFKKIEDQNKTIKEFRKTLEEFGKHHAQVRKLEFDRALASLKAAKKEALELGDADKVIEMDERIDMVKDAQRTAAQQPVVNVPNVPESNPVFDAWVNRNGWYNNNEAMRAFADLLNKIEQEVKKEFAHKFQNPNREKASAVEGSTNKGTSKKSDSYQLSETERRVAERFVKSIPGYTMEKYVEELKALNKKQGA
jgi:hypothetical protein